MMSRYLPDVLDAVTIWNTYLRAGTPFFAPSDAGMHDRSHVRERACKRVRIHILCVLLAELALHLR